MGRTFSPIQAKHIAWNLHFTKSDPENILLLDKLVKFNAFRKNPQTKAIRLNVHMLDSIQARNNNN